MTEEEKSESLSAKYEVNRPCSPPHLEHEWAALTGAEQAEVAAWFLLQATSRSATDREHEWAYRCCGVLFTVGHDEGYARSHAEFLRAKGHHPVEILRREVPSWEVAPDDASGS